MLYRSSDNNLQRRFEKLTSCTTSRPFKIFRSDAWKHAKNTRKVREKTAERALKVEWWGKAQRRRTSVYISIYSNRRAWRAWRARRARYLNPQQHFSASTPAISMNFFFDFGVTEPEEFNPSVRFQK